MEKVKNAAINFQKLNGIIPVVVQDVNTLAVLMVGFMNKEALEKTMREGKITYWSRTREKLWTKGETSGNFQLVKKIWIDCDNDTLLVQVEQLGHTCHTGNKTCFSKPL